MRTTPSLATPFEGGDLRSWSSTNPDRNRSRLPSSPTTSICRLLTHSQERRSGRTHQVQVLRFTRAGRRRRSG
eukprot:3954502-Prymnesium_polylepis.1